VDNPKQEESIVSGINFREVVLESLSDYENKCYCPMTGPEGLMAIGCQCGGK
jgi:hypothetical protein